MSSLRSSAFWEKIRASLDCHITSLLLSPSLILSIAWLLLWTYLLWRSVAFSASSPPLFGSQSGSCLGPLGPCSYQLVMGPGGSGPRPWTQTDWLPRFISALGTLCSLPSPAHCCAVRAKPDKEECGSGANMNLIQTRKQTHAHTHWDALTKALRGYIQQRFIITM